MRKKQQTQTPSPEEIFARIVEASVALSELDRVVTAFEKNGGREQMVNNPAWLPFLETVDLLTTHSGYLSGHAADLFPDAVGASEEAYDEAKSNTK